VYLLAVGETVQVLDDDAPSDFVHPPVPSWSHTIENFAPAVLFVYVTDVTLAVIAAGSKRVGDLELTSASEKVGVAEKDDVTAVEPVNTLPPPDPPQFGAVQDVPFDRTITRVVPPPTVTSQADAPSLTSATLSVHEEAVGSWFAPAAMVNLASARGAVSTVCPRASEPTATSVAMVSFMMG